MDDLVLLFFLAGDFDAALKEEMLLFRGVFRSFQGAVHGLEEDDAAAKGPG
jgi:hypothetical protein